MTEKFHADRMGDAVAASKTETRTHLPQPDVLEYYNEEAAGSAE